MNISILDTSASAEQRLVCARDRERLRKISTPKPRNLNLAAQEVRTRKKLESLKDRCFILLWWLRGREQSSLPTTTLTLPLQQSKPWNVISCRSRSVYTTREAAFSVKPQYPITAASQEATPAQELARSQTHDPVHLEPEGLFFCSKMCASE